MSRLTRPQIEDVLRNCLRELAPEEQTAEWLPTDQVITKWGLDSQHGVELACDLESLLGIAVPLKENPLVCDDEVQGKRRARTFSEVVDYIECLAS